MEGVFIVVVVGVITYFFTEEKPPTPTLSDSQHAHMLILMRVLYGNPRVLYAPNDTQVDVIMKKVRI